MWCHPLALLPNFGPDRAHPFSGLIDAGGCQQATGPATKCFITLSRVRIERCGFSTHHEYADGADLTVVSRVHALTAFELLTAADGTQRPAAEPECLA